MKNILNAPYRLSDRDKRWRVFCAGPIQGGPDWQNNMPELDNVLWISPRRTDYKDFSWTEQTQWEHDYMLSADIILFWIPEKIEDFEHRSYAQTTRTEFGEYIGRGKKIIFGSYKQFPGRRYFEAKLKEYGQGTAHDSLEGCISEIQKYISECEAEPKIFFTSDTHFGSQRTLELSQRPFLNTSDMDWHLIQKWNDKVHPCDKVFHLGDFGDDSALRYLNGEIFFISGNYERERKLLVPDIPKDHCLEDIYTLEQSGKKYTLTHEPLNVKGEDLSTNPKAVPVLFGHIHGRQKIKKFGLDVGCDSWNYAPISLEEVEFYLNGIRKNFYDKEVWS